MGVQTMVFSSMTFTFIFLPIVLFVYYLAKEQYRNVILLVASLIFYACGEPRFVLVMLASILVNYVLALLIDRNEDAHIRKVLLAVAVILNLSVLYVFKYFNFSVNIFNHIAGTDFPFQPILLPIGISFFTFQAMSYVIDVYRHDADAEKNILNVGLYIALFPQLVAGPIVRYNTIAAQIKKRTSSLEKSGEGAKRFICGFCKKIILANNLAIVAERAFFEVSPEQSVLMVWFGSICYSLQIFYDFSGYSDMAIGLGKMFGFEFEENFNYPYVSGSVTEFWRRWHISLSSWFRDYVYIPLGGSRVSLPRHVFNLLVVWMLTGLWHGARTSFVLWGLWYFVWLILEKFFIKPWKWKNHLLRFGWRIVTLLVVNLGWVLFNTESVSVTIQCALNMVAYYGNPMVDVAVLALLRQYFPYFIIGIICSLPIVPWVKEKMNKISAGRICLVYAVPILYVLVFLWAVSFIVLGSHNPFIYFNF